MVYYITLVHKEPDSGYCISFPDVPGITAVADTLDDAMREAATALAFAFEDWEGELPAPRTLDALRQDEDFLALSVDAVVAAVAPASNLEDAT
ncbi:HicB-like antitoxin of HicAB toxin-antitoxin system [Hoeflea halophila]|uniref:HicB-like antitoxin of HicAB toxin-antitoxin system n=1 Tax=Hoeflea halophila TaxID=714899 RepID=A0A286I0L9_9HYPH|nr:type II toxin-antitoxin system HicB family antitoxin [Hoeflea halophila]SOE13527.1 HicB-like antitoxin of HicAB toxin-antitoxin system [Hoeflea halophila]